MGTSDSQPCNQWHRWQPGLAMASEAGWFGGQPSGGLRLPQWLSGKESACSAGDAGDTGSIPGLGRSPGKENGSPLQYSCLENPMDRGVWWFTVHRVTKNWTRLKRLSTHACVGSCAIFGSVRITWNGKTPQLGLQNCLVMGNPSSPWSPYPTSFSFPTPVHTHILELGVRIFKVAKWMKEEWERVWRSRLLAHCPTHQTLVKEISLLFPSISLYWRCMCV